MTILVRKALIIDPHSPYHQLQQDIFIENGVITEIADHINRKASQVIDIAGIVVSPGWIDVFAHFNDPGAEHKETLASGAAAAAAGGFTTVFVVPNTQPVVESKSQVEYIVQRSQQFPVTILPLGAVTKGTEGKALAEMYDMKSSGAIAFSDGISPVQSAGLLLKALQYVKAFDGIVLQVPEDKSMSAHGLMNEGITSTRMGLPGIPALAEEIQIKRDIDLAQYTGSKIHFTGVSTAKGIELISAARASNVKVSCSVTPFHLMFSEDDLADYNTNLKVSPPLRTKADVAALKQAVLNGEVDCIATHHFPQHIDNKICEFEYAKPGMIGLQTAFSVLNTLLPELSTEDLVQLLYLKPAQLFGLQTQGVTVGAAATLSLFDREQPFIFTAAQNQSRSANSPLFDTPLRGKVIGIIHKGEVFLNA